MDFKQAETLLNVMQMAMGYPDLRRLHDAAMAELKKIQSQPVEDIPSPTILRNKTSTDTERKV